MSAELFRRAFDRNPVAMVISSLPDGRCIQANDAFLRATGYSREDLADLAAGGIHLLADADVSRSIQAETSRTGGVREAQVRVRSGSGEVVVGCLSSRVLHIGRRSYLVSAVEEATARGIEDDGSAARRAEAVFRDAPVAMAVLDGAGSITQANTRLGRMVGLSPHELVGRGLASLVDAEDRGRLAAAMCRVVTRRGAETRLEVRCATQAGEPVWADVSLSTTGDESAGKGALLAVLVDISRARSAHLRAQARSAETLELALLGADVALWDLDLTTGELNCQPRWTSRDGLDLPSHRTSLELFASAIHPDDLPSLVAANEAHMRGQSTHCEAEFRVRAEQGEWRWLRQRCRIVERDEHDRPVRVAGTYVDITERKRADREREALQAQIQHGQKLESLGVLAGGIAHDFKNILMGVLGNTSLAMLSLPEDAPAREHICQAEEAARKASELASQMLAYSGKGERVVGPVDLAQLAHQMLGLLRASVPTGVELRLEPARGACTVTGDHCRLGQVLLNLIVNAAEAIGEKEGSVTVRLERAVHDGGPRGDQELPPGDYVILQVSDTGCGMDQETRRRAFEPFYTTKSRGQGLGLATVIGVVREHRGAAEVDSQVGRGTTFSVLLPAAPQPDECADASPTAAAQGGARRGTLLIADDDDTVRAVTRAVLEMAGFRTALAADGQQALDVLAGEAGRVIGCIVDLNMPGLRGDEVARRIACVRPDLPVILTSGAVVDEAGLPAAAVLQKPYGVRELLDTVHRVLPAEPGR